MSACKRISPNIGTISILQSDGRKVVLRNVSAVSFEPDQTEDGMLSAIDCFSTVMRNVVVNIEFAKESISDFRDVIFGAVEESSLKLRRRRRALERSRRNNDWMKRRGITR